VCVSVAHCCCCSQTVKNPESDALCISVIHQTEKQTHKNIVLNGERKCKNVSLMVGLGVGLENTI